MCSDSQGNYTLEHWKRGQRRGGEELIENTVKQYVAIHITGLV